MNEELKLLRMYATVHGDMSGVVVERMSTFYPSSDFGDDDPLIVAFVKDGNLCWHYTKEELLFDYITRDWA